MSTSRDVCVTNQYYMTKIRILPLRLINYSDKPLRAVSKRYIIIGMRVLAYQPQKLHVVPRQTLEHLDEIFYFSHSLHCWTSRWV
jgi:hypothetical protein